MTPGAAQRCGNCKHWQVLNERELQDHTEYALGECMYPLPFWIERFRPYHKAGKDCPTWQAK